MPRGGTKYFEKLFKKRPKNQFNLEVSQDERLREILGNRDQTRRKEALREFACKNLTKVAYMSMFSFRVPYSTTFLLRITQFPPDFDNTEKVKDIGLVLSGLIEEDKLSMPYLDEGSSVTASMQYDSCVRNTWQFERVRVRRRKSFQSEKSSKSAKNTSISYASALTTNSAQPTTSTRAPSFVMVDEQSLNSDEDTGGVLDEENISRDENQDGFTSKSRTKRPRAPPPPEEDYNDEPEQELDERNNQLGDNYVPSGFLSPSVQEYLELGKSIPGRPGTDYPVLGEVPYTNFYCDEQPYPGFFADMDTRCQGWHYCDIDGRQTTFLCPNGTQFSQAVFVCDWWFNVRCDLSPRLYAINARLYGRPKMDPAKPHRTITKQLLEDIFNDE